MPKFSETIKNEIKQSKRTLLYLFDASGLSLNHISKYVRVNVFLEMKKRLKS